jgi:hypothetical protein
MKMVYCRRSSAGTVNDGPRLAAARVASAIDFCSFAVLMASQKEASIWTSSATDSREKHSAKPVQFGTPPVANPVGDWLLSTSVG